MINIGVTQYELSQFEGGYGVQRNTTTNRGRSKFICKEHLQDESCSPCMEEFKDTPHFPKRTTSCLNTYKVKTPCPMCRKDIKNIFHIFTNH